jgi:anti-sigma factor RsiW
MNCSNTQNLIDAYVDRELDLERNLEIERHLEDCALCSQACEDHQALRDAISASSLYFKSSANLRKRVQSSLRKASRAETARNFVPSRWLTLAASLATVVVVTWSVIHVFSVPSSDDLLTHEVLSSHQRSLMANHLADVSSSDQHTVKPWFAGKVDFSPPVEDLTKQGFPLIGGRLDYLENRPVAALVYQRHKHVINLFIWPSASESDVPTKAVSRQGYNLFHWTQSHMTYWASSDLDKSELQEFVKQVQDQTSAKP